MDFVFNAVGFAGAMAAIVAYYMLQQGSMASTGLPYLLLNLVGSLAILVSLVRYWNLSVCVVESAWALISVYGLVRHSTAGK